MGKKTKTGSGGIVYSTDPSFRLEEALDKQNTLPPAQQRLRVWLDSRQRAGKTVTLVTGFTGKEEDLELLGKELKTQCGSGGAVKEGEIIIQGDHRDKVVQWLVKKGYSDTRRAGG